jgi:transcriptional regulator with XRE-family HTH domain
MFFDQYEMLCRKAKKSPNGVAKEIGFSSASVTQWKNGAAPREDTLKLICEYFKVKPGYILGYTPDAQIDFAKYQIEKLTKKWVKCTNEDERQILAFQIDDLRESLNDLTFSRNIEIAAEQAKKNTRPAKSGTGSAYAQSIYDFVDSCEAGQLADLAQYVEFLKSRQGKPTT